MSFIIHAIELLAIGYIAYVACKVAKNWRYVLGLDIDAKEEEERRHVQVQHNIATANAFAPNKAA
ncbi:hypothetical protein [Secundilactobacillus kimchicus]|uniref:hypothetical protein n=1 Tax=Secundilactobacillus kimchicus TaxID=528209 RepID=UPI0024A83E2B|nr:hypothetical protein [Secundilactobacillus kimchicus]